MHVEAFWKHWQVREDPFRAEEARNDPVFARLLESDTSHPEFEKVYGQPDQPATAVVFGEKGSGKTALRLMLEQRLERHNDDNPDRRAWIVRYDDLNPILDRFTHAHFNGRSVPDDALDRFRLADHQDAMLSRATTRLVDALLNEPDSPPLAEHTRKTARKMGRDRRVNLAVLAALYDQPMTGATSDRWPALKRVLRLGWMPTLAMAKWLGGLLAVLVAGLAIARRLSDTTNTLTVVLTGLCAAGAILLLGYWAWRSMSLWRLARRIRKEVHVVDRSRRLLRQMLGDLSSKDIAAQPLPEPGDQDSRYQLTLHLMQVLSAFGYRSMIILVDRVDEPAMINGDAKKMRALIWPMFNNKFLQQDRVGIKLLLPVELRHLLAREDPEFYQRARLDKQHMIDRLVWSGATLYDLCSSRLTACLEPGAEPISVVDLFDEQTTRQDLVDALDQMQQPRDAFKFLYRVIQEHCSNVTQDDPVWRIPRLTLTTVRKQQSQRVQDFHRGVAPA